MGKPFLIIVETRDRMLDTSGLLRVRSWFNEPFLQVTVYLPADWHFVVMLRFGFARRGEKIAQAIERQPPLTLLVACRNRGEFLT